MHELNHRWFNCLQLVSFSIDSCRRAVSALPEVEKKLSIIGDRLQAHASVHKLLSHAPNPGLLEGYCRELCLDLIHAFGREDLNLFMHMEGEGLKQAQAFRMALLVVELLTNVLKHSLAQENGGSIWIDLQCAEEGWFELTARDSKLTPCEPKSEPRIVHALARSLGGTVEVSCDNGYVARVRFPTNCIGFA
jgi:two-component sensor histidine kinase